MVCINCRWIDKVLAYLTNDDPYQENICMFHVKQHAPQRFIFMILKEFTIPFVVFIAAEL